MQRSATVIYGPVSSEEVDSICELVSFTSLFKVLRNTNKIPFTSIVLGMEVEISVRYLKTSTDKLILYFLRTKQFL